jgi:hypothetical protein
MHVTNTKLGISRLGITTHPDDLYHVKQPVAAAEKMLWVESPNGKACAASFGGPPEAVGEAVSPHAVGLGGLWQPHRAA